MNKLPVSFYQKEDVVVIAKKLLGKRVFSMAGNLLTGGIIVETEAYRGPEDRGSHAWNNRRTNRTEIMYAAGGVAYMYICYGIHDMLNVVTGPADTSHAILIRAIEPTTGLDMMRERRNIFDKDVRLCQGPGALAQALGLNKMFNGKSLQGNELWIEDDAPVPEEQIIASARIGMNFDGPFKTIPWRFYIKGNRYVSRPHS
jgi:DNA-3-methyladenine glycosylase